MKALIVSDFDKEIFSYADSARFFDYLVNETGMTKDDVVFYGPAEARTGINFYNIFLALCKATINEPLVIYYAGHGTEEGWNPKDDVIIYYEILAKFLDSRLAPLIFINDCCFGMAAADYLSTLKCRKLVLGLAPKNLVGETDGKSLLLSDVFSYWRKGRLARPRYRIKKKYLPKEFQNISVDSYALRWGDGIDYLLFPEMTMRWRLYYASQLLFEIAEFFLELLQKIIAIIKPPRKF